MAAHDRMASGVMECAVWSRAWASGCVQGPPPGVAPGGRRDGQDGRTSGERTVGADSGRGLSRRVFRAIAGHARASLISQPGGPWHQALGHRAFARARVFPHKACPTRTPCIKPPAHLTQGTSRKSAMRRRGLVEGVFKGRGALDPWHGGHGVGMAQFHCHPRRQARCRLNFHVGKAPGSRLPEQGQGVVAHLALGRRRVGLEAVGPSPESLKSQTVPRPRGRRAPAGRGRWGLPANSLGAFPAGQYQVSPSTSACSNRALVWARWVLTCVCRCGAP